VQTARLAEPFGGHYLESPSHRGMRESIENVREHGRPELPPEKTRELDAEINKREQFHKFMLEKFMNPADPLYQQDWLRRRLEQHYGNRG
jgi:hypothetical protein